jgi:hypothetical protein
MSTGEFSVYQFFPDESYERVAKWMGGEEAVTLARQLTQSLGARIGTTRRVIITDGLDSTVFEWRHGEGVTWPPEARGKS